MDIVSARAWLVPAVVEVVGQPRVGFYMARPKFCGIVWYNASNRNFAILGVAGVANRLG